MNVKLTARTTTSENVWVGHRARIDEKVAAVAKRLARLDAPAPTVEFGPAVWVTDRDDNGYEISYQVYTTVTVTGVVAAYDGWTPVASLDHTLSDDEALVAKFPDHYDTVIPDRFRFSGSVCDHCGQNRNRNTTVVFVSDTGEWIQVGTTCLIDFIGVDPNTVLTLAAAAGVTDDDEFGPPARTEFTPVQFVGVADAVIRDIGFVKSRPDDYTQTPTKDVVRNVLTGTVRLSDFDTGVDADRVAAIVEFVAGMPDGEFAHSARLAINAPVITDRTVGILAAIPAVYQRHLDDAAREAAPDRVGGFVGDVGDKVAVVGEIVSAFNVDTQFGISRRVTLVTDDGQTVTTFGSGRDLFAVERGERVEWRGTVKAQETDERYGDQTVFARVKLLPPPTRLDTVKIARKGDEATTFIDRRDVDDYGLADAEMVTGEIVSVKKRDDRWTYEIDGADGWRYAHEIDVAGDAAIAS